MKSSRIAIILLIVCMSMFTVVAQLFAGVLGNCITISGDGGRFSDVAYNKTNGNYLVVWTDYASNPICVSGRLVSNDGAVIGDPFQISNDLSYAMMPSVAYNAANNEYLVAWIDGRYVGTQYDIVHCQRVSATGAFKGGNHQIGDQPGALCSVAWSSGSNCYLVTYHWPSGNKEVFGRLVYIVNDAVQMGSVFNISNDTDFSTYSHTAYNPLNDEFLVTWDQENVSDEVRNIFARRVKASTGQLMGTVINATNSFGKDRSCVTYDTINNRWFIRSNDYRNASTNSYDQYAQLLNADGSLYLGNIPIATASYMEGDTQRCGGLSFIPAAQRYFSSFQANGKMTGCETDLEGQNVNGPIDLSAGSTELEPLSCSNAADTDRNRILTVWDSRTATGGYVSGRIYAIPFNAVSSFVATAQDRTNQLSWTNPTNIQFTSTMIRYKTTGYPTNPDDGTLLTDRAGLPGSADTYTHTNLTNGTTYYYSAFPHDAVFNYAPVAMAVATPSNLVRINIRSSNFNSGFDSWITSTWKSGTLAAGAISLNGNAVLCTGSGDTDNEDRCNREGAEIRKTISTSNRENIFVSYDIKVNSLGNDRTGAGIGTCAVDHNLIDDQLTVYYSTNAGSSWNELESVRRGDLVPNYQGFAARQIDLSQISSCNRNSQFALRFRWQLNTVSDMAYLDNIVVQGTLIPPIVTDDGAYTGSLSKLHCRWVPVGTGFIEYKYCIGTSSGASNIVNWTNVGSATEVLREDLTLSEGQTYYFSVQAANSLGYWSPSGYSDGITAPVGVGIQDAKGVANIGQIRAIRGKVVSAAFPDCFYIQEPDSYFGIRAVSPTAVLAGQTLDIAGVLSGANSERYIDCTGNPISAAIPGLVSIDALAMNNLSIGGPLFNTITPGVLGGRGVNNLGSLIRLWGKVTQRDAVDNQYFYIDDGSGLRDGTKTAGVDNIGIRMKADPTAYPADSFVVITGISSCFADASNNLRPQVLPKP